MVMVIHTWQCSVPRFGSRHPLINLWGASYNSAVASAVEALPFTPFRTHYNIGPLNPSVNRPKSVFDPPHRCHFNFHHQRITLRRLLHRRIRPFQHQSRPPFRPPGTFVRSLSGLAVYPSTVREYSGDVSSVAYHTFIGQLSTDVARIEVSMAENSAQTARIDSL